MCRRRSTGSSASASDLATGGGSDVGLDSNALEALARMTEADEYEGEATSTAAGGACDSDGNPRVRAFQRAASHARSSASRDDASS